MVALPPSLSPRTASAGSKKASTKWSSKKWIQSLLLAVLTISSVLGTSIYTAPKAQAAQSSFATVFEDCSDTASESTWPEMKTCLQGVTMEAKYQTVWANVIRPKLVQFFDNHALSDGGVDDAILHKPFIYGATFPAATDMDRQISTFLREENGGRDRFDEIGDVIDKALEGSREDVLCQIKDVPNLIYVSAGGESSSTPSFCLHLTDAGSDDYLINGLSNAVLYVLADIISTDSFTVAVEDPRVTGLITDVRGMMGSLKTYIGDDAHQVTRTTRTYKSLKAFFSAQDSSTSVLDSGEIKGMMQYCQGGGIVSGITPAQAGSTAQSYIMAVKDCYNTYVINPRSTMSDRSKEFVTKIMLPATEAYSDRVATFSPGGQAKAKEFMQSRDYLQLGEAYGPLASRRSEYPMADYLGQTINDSYTDSVSWVHDETGNNEISLSAGAPIGYISNFDDSVEPAILWHLFLINNELVKDQNYTIFLDRPLAAAPATTTSAAPAPASTSGGNTEAQNRQVFLGEVHAVRRVQVQSNRNVLQQMNDYINRSLSANKPVMLFAWFWLAVKDHDPNYPSSIVHSTGDLSLVTESIVADGPLDRYFSDPYLARITNACSPNLVLDRVSKDDLRPWKACLEHEQEYVDKSDTNRAFKPHKTSTLSFDMTLGSNLLPFKMRRSQPVVEALQSLVQRIQSCIDRDACLSLNDRDEGDRATQQSGNNPGTPDASDSMLNSILAIINLILGLVIKFLLWLTALVMSFFQSVLSYAGFTTSDFVVKMWKAVRDFVNLFFILALLGIAVANIVQYEINNYAVKTILPKLIIVVIAVNFSRLIVGVGIDAGNVIEAGIYQIAGMGPHGGGTQAVCSTNTSQVGTLDVAIPQDIKDGSILCRLARGLRFQELQNYRENNSADTSTLTSLFLINVAILLILIMMLFGFLALAVTFTVRIIVLWALAITSPIFVISKISPIGSGIASEWQGKFTKYAFMQIKVAFFLTLAVLASEAVGSQIFANLANTSPAVGGGSLSPVGFNSLADYLQLVFVIAMIYAAAFTSAKGDYGNSIVDGIAKYGQNPFSGVRKGASLAGKSLGITAGAFGYVGNRMQDKKGSGLGSRAIRLAGGFLAAPTNIASGAKAVVGDLKHSAQDRKERFGANMAQRMAFGDDMKQRFRAKVVENELKIINSIANDAKLRFDPATIRDMAQKAFERKDDRSYRGYMTALAQSGALDVNEIANPRTKQTFRDQIIEAEKRRDPSAGEKEAYKVADSLEQTSLGASKAMFDDGKGFAARTQDKQLIRLRMREAMQKGNKSYALGILTAAFEGRIADDGEPKEEGAGIALEMWQEMQRPGNKFSVTDNDRRKLTKDIAKEGVASIGMMLGNADGEAKHLQRVYEAAKQMGLIRNNVENLASIKDEQARASADHIVSMLAAVGKYRYQNADGSVTTRYLSEAEAGRKALESVAKAQIGAFGEIKPAGDDGNIRTMIQQLDASAMALASSMTESGKFRGDNTAKMVREAIQGYIQNAALIGNRNGTGNEKDAADFNINNLNKYLETLSGTITTEAQLNTIKQQLDLIGDSVKNAAPKDYSETQKAAIATQLESFRNNLVSKVQSKPLVQGGGVGGTAPRRPSGDDEPTT